MNIVSINVNGLKAFYEKGAFDELISRFNPDILCIQETKCSESKVGYWISDYNYEYVPYAISNHWKHGYAGVATLIKESVLDRHKAVYYPTFPEFKEHQLGRVVVNDFDDFQLINIYWQNSGDKDEQRRVFDKNLHSYIKYMCSRKHTIVIGDLNVVPSELDYWGNFEANRDSLPGLKYYEESNHNRLKNECNLVDSFRELNPETRSYSWYSYQGGAREKNHGWRIDLALVSKNFMGNIKSSKVHSNFLGSDHCPIELIIE